MIDFCKLDQRTVFYNDIKTALFRLRCYKNLARSERKAIINLIPALIPTLLLKTVGVMGN